MQTNFVNSENDFYEIYQLKEPLIFECMTYDFIGGDHDNWLLGCINKVLLKCTICYCLQHLGLWNEPNDAEPMTEGQEEKEDVEGVKERSVLYMDQRLQFYVMWCVSHFRFNPLTAKLFNLNFHPLEVVSR